VGGRLFPGVHHHSRFEVEEGEGRYSLRMSGSDQEIEVIGRRTDSIPASSVFEDLAQASRFFERGSLGYSATPAGDRHDGLELRTDGWSVEALDVESVSSSYFSNRDRFPDGSVEFDCGLLMEGIPHEWPARDPICCSSTNGLA